MGGLTVFHFAVNLDGYVFQNIFLVSSPPFGWVLLNSTTDACSVKKNHVIKSHFLSYNFFKQLQKVQKEKQVILKCKFFSSRLRIVLKPERKGQFKEQLIAKPSLKYCFDLSKILIWIFIWCMRTACMHIFVFKISSPSCFSQVKIVALTTVLVQSGRGMNFLMFPSLENCGINIMCRNLGIKLHAVVRIDLF